MRVFVDAVQDSPETTGSDRVARSILARLPGLLPEAEFLIGVRRGSPEPAASITADVSYVSTVGSPSRRLWLLATMPAIAARFRPDVTLGLYNCLLPPVGRGASIVTVFDLVPFRLAEDYYPSRLHRLATQSVMRRSLKRADAAAVLSQATLADLNSFVGHSRPFALTPPAVDPAFAVPPPAAVARVLAAYDLPPRFVLTIGSREPRKNLAGVVAGYRALPAEARAEVPLVVIGAPWTRAGTDRVLEPGLRELGYVPEGDLAALYGAASVFVFLSRYEGFGLPIVEAMACGTPVVCGDATSLPEAAGGAATVVPGEDAAAVAAGILALLESPSLAQSHVSAGLSRVSELTWDSAATAYAALIREVA